MAIITETQTSSAIPSFVLQEAIGRLQSNMVMGRLVGRDASNQVANFGKTVNVPKRGSLTVSDKAEGAAITSENPANTSVAVTLDTHKYVSWYMEDRADATAVDDAVDYAGDAMIALAEAIESDLLGLYASAGGTDQGTAGSDLTEQAILDTRKEQNDNKVPMTGRKLVISTKDEIALLKLDKFSSADKIGNAGETIREASLGRLYGYDTFVSQLVPVTAGTPDTTHNFAFHPDSIMMVSRPLALPQPGQGAQGVIMTDTDLGISMRYTQQWSADDLATKHVIDILYGVAMVDDRLATEVQS